MEPDTLTAPEQVMLMALEEAEQGWSEYFGSRVRVGVYVLASMCEVPRETVEDIMYGLVRRGRVARGVACGESVYMSV